MVNKLPKGKRPKTEFIGMRVDAPLKLRLTQLASNENRTLTNYVQTLLLWAIDQEERRQTLKPRPVGSRIEKPEREEYIE